MEQKKTRAKKIGINAENLARLFEQHPHTEELEGLNPQDYVNNRLDLVKEFQVCTMSWLNKELGRSPGYTTNLKKHIKIKAEIAEKLHTLTNGFIHRKYSVPPVVKEEIKESDLAELAEKHPNGPHHAKMSERQYLRSRLTLLGDAEVCTLSYLNKQLGKSSGYLHRLTIDEVKGGGDNLLKISPATAMGLHEMLNGFIDIHYSMPDLAAPDSDVKLSKAEHEQLNQILASYNDQKKAA